MSTIVTRAGKGSPLTWNEVDNNFTNLNTDKLQSGNTAAALTITSATINGGAINNATIGATTATTGKFTSLTSSALTSGRVTFASTGGLLADSANLVWDNTNARLGIGTASPTDKLEVVSTAQYSGATIQGGTTAGAGILTLKNSNAAGIWQLGVYGSGISGTANDLYIYDGVANAVRAVMDNSGNLGLGVTPSAWNTNVKVAQLASGSLYSYSTVDLELTQNCYYSTGNQWIYSTTAQAERYSMYNGQHQWWIAPSGTAGTAITFTQAMTLDASGNVGIGTASPSYKLHVVGGQGRFDVSSAGTSLVCLGTGSNFQVDHATSGYATLINSANTGAAMIFKGSSESMRIDTSGNLIVRGTTQYSSAITTITGGLAGTNQNLALVQTDNTSSHDKIFFVNTNGIVGKVTTSGSTTTYATSSDYRLKENITPMTGALATIAQLKPVTYNWKSDGSDGQGFIAHELAEVVPDCVIGEKDATEEEQYEISPAIPAVLDEEGNEITPAVEAVMGTRTVPVYQGIDTSFLVATLTAAIQEQQAMIDELKAKVAALEAA